MKTKVNPMAEGIIREGIIKLENLDFKNKFFRKWYFNQRYMISISTNVARSRAFD